jgi:hypothetical protein
VIEDDHILKLVNIIEPAVEQLSLDGEGLGNKGLVFSKAKLFKEAELLDNGRNGILMFSEAAFDGGY